MSSSNVILAGMRPTGALHLGHYVGVIRNIVELQKDFECYFFVADWHALTSNFDNLEIIRKSRIEYVKGWLASGVDPKKTHIYKQSSMPEVLYLNQLFLSLTPPGWADRSPSWKDQVLNPAKKLDNLGFYTYPVLQAADIAVVNANWVPVGEDQIAHVEIAREIVRKFNRTYNTEIAEPQAKLTKIPKLQGIGGKKMSSSLGNVITLQESEKSLQKKINKLKTDDERKGIEFPGNPVNCHVFEYYSAFAPEIQGEVECACKKGELGCGECKQNLGEYMKKELMPIASKMNSISDQECLDVLKEGDEFVSERMKFFWDKINKLIRFL